MPQLCHETELEYWENSLMLPSTTVSCVERRRWQWIWKNSPAASGVQDLEQGSQCSANAGECSVFVFVCLFGSGKEVGATSSCAEGFLLTQCSGSAQGSVCSARDWIRVSYMWDKHLYPSPALLGPELFFHSLVTSDKALQCPDPQHKKYRYHWCWVAFSVPRTSKDSVSYSGQFHQRGHWINSGWTVGASGVIWGHFRFLEEHTEGFLFSLKMGPNKFGKLWLRKWRWWKKRGQKSAGIGQDRPWLFHRISCAEVTLFRTGERSAASTDPRNWAYFENGYWLLFWGGGLITCMFNQFLFFPSSLSDDQLLGSLPAGSYLFP